MKYSHGARRARSAAARAAIAMAGCAPLLCATAATIETGNPNLAIRFDNEVRYNAGWRMQDIADLLGVRAIALGGPIGVRLAIPVIGLFASLHGPTEGVFDLVAFRGIHRGAISGRQQGCKYQCC